MIPWTPVHELAARRLAEDRMTNREIAKEAGVDKRILQYWIGGGTGASTKGTFPEFPARVKALREEMIAAIGGVTLQPERLLRANQDWQRLQQIRRERADDPSMENVPGGTTGLIVRTYKGVGKGDEFRLMEEFSVDTGMLAELRAIEDRVAKELGQLAPERIASEGAIKVIFEYENDPGDPEEAA